MRFSDVIVSFAQHDGMKTLKSGHNKTDTQNLIPSLQNPNWSYSLRTVSNINGLNIIL